LQRVQGGRGPWAGEARVGESEGGQARRKEG
jgi:hypothetical protein